MTKYYICLFILLSSLASFSGCGGGGSEDSGYKLSGTITFDGNPVPRGTINFTPTSSGKGATAGIMDGKFETKSGHSGGEYSIKVYGFDGVPIKTGEGDMDENGTPLFKEYTTSETLPEEDSTLDITVPK